jgi:hypothetical protein
MAIQRSIKLNPVWANAPIEKIVSRVESIIVGERTSSFTPFEKPNSGGSWQIDSGNNWFMHVVDDTLFLTGRYADAQLMASLSVVFTWVFGGWNASNG